MKSTGPTRSVSEVFAPPPAAGREPTLSLDDILAARERLRGVVLETPCRVASGLRRSVDGEVFLKHECLQRTRSFKERGAANALLQLRAEERRAGVVAASAGNHGLGLAWHGFRLGVSVLLVIPANAPRAKVDRCRAFGARVELCGTSFEAADFRARELARQQGRYYIHPFDDVAVMAGQGTVVLEILEQVPELEALVLPVGGGGLLAGAAIAIRGLRSAVRVVAVEPTNAASFRAAEESANPVEIDVQPTLADGLAVSRVGTKPFAATRGLVDRAVTVSEVEIAQAMVHLFEVERVVAEGAGAVALAAVLHRRDPELSQLRSVALVGGGNVDATTFARALQLGARAA